jgi:hypothetical protein
MPVASELVAKLVGAGDPGVMMPAATAIAAWLLTGRTYRLAICWALLFAVGVAAVAASKVAFLAWGAGIREIELKAFSGHAMQTTAVAPVLFHLLLQKRGRAVRMAGTVAGLACGGAMGILLTAFGYHSLAESVAGCTIGAMVSLGFLRIFGNLAPCPRHSIMLPVGAAVFLVTWLCWSLPLESLLREMALRLSGRQAIYSYKTWQPGH